MLRPGLGVLLVLALTGVATSLGARSRAFVQIAEGLTSATLTEGIRVAPRMFAASQLVEACKDPRVVARLKVAPDRLEIGRNRRVNLIEHPQHVALHCRDRDAVAVDDAMARHAADAIASGNDACEVQRVGGAQRDQPIIGG